MANKNTRSLSSRKGLENNLFESISELSENNAGEEEFQRLAAQFLMDDSVVFGTASFYDFIKPENRANKIKICNGTACMLAGSQDSIASLVSKHFEDEEVGHAACVGRCHSNGAIMFNDKTYSVTSEDDLIQIIKAKSDTQDFENRYAVASNTTPILTSKVDNIENFFALAERFVSRPLEITEALKTSKLRGRGGAGFPFWFKLDAVAKEVNSKKYIVCNADEGDPGAYSDMYLMEHQPYKVLLGMYLSGICVGADTGVLYIRGEYPHSVESVNEAIQSLNGKNLLNGFTFKIIKGQGSYVCGEETALLNSIEGLRPEVRVRPPYPAQYGLFGKPTVLSNVETFANIPWILENGGEAFASIGTKESTGTKLVSLDSFFNQPGIFEIEMGTALLDIFMVFGKGYNQAIKGFQIGGPLGGIVPLDKIKELNLDFESLNKAGFLLGHASVVSIPEAFPMVKFLEHLLEFTAEESCGKCYPCRIGSHRGFEMLQKAQNEDYKIDRQLFDDLIETLEIGSLCALGGGVPLPVKNALQYFEEELSQFFQS